jgi:hypothetical protein
LPVAQPGGRSLLSWWRELAGRDPRRLWFGHLLLHRVEALAEVARPSALDTFQQGLLRALSRPGQAEALRLERQLLAQVLRELEGRGLVRLGPGAEGEMELTEAGRSALAESERLETTRERRVFVFVERPAGAPVYLPLAGWPGAPLSGVEGWGFDPEVLRGCAGRPPEWKGRRQFPADVVNVIAGEAPADWREVMVDRAEQLTLLLVEVPPAPGGPSLLGLPVRTEGWVLSPETPALALDEHWPEALTGLVTEPTAEEWRQAWQAWCAPRGLPPGEVAECNLEASGHTLLVRAPAKLVDRLRQARSDAVKGEAWLLAGSGRVRQAALVELVEGQ